MAAELRITDGRVEPEEPEAGVIRRLLATAEAMVSRYAPDAPDAITDEAVIRLVGWWYDAPPSPGNTRHSAPMLSSGAAAILKPWRPLPRGK